MKLILLTLAVAVLTSCEQFKAFVIANEAAIVNATAKGARIGAAAGIARLKTSGKSPVDVQP